jgi:hypothetical protein
MRAITASRAEHFPIGELSRLTGVNNETIRYYERMKMLLAPPRTASVDGRRRTATWRSERNWDPTFSTSSRRFSYRRVET